MDIGLTADVHSHILPGVDDGSPNPEESLAILEECHRRGVRNVIFTPHVARAMFPNSAEALQARFAAFIPTLPETLRTEMRFHLASEYMVDEFFVTSPDRLCWPDGQHILIEMSYYERSREIRDEIFQLQLNGLKPVLAHPERYVFYQKAYDKKKGVAELEQFFEAGCQLQLNVMSLTGAYGEGSMAVLRWLLDHDMYSFIGTDVHSRRQMDHFDGLQITSAQLEKVRQLARNNETLFG
ncbi:MAG: hypothetical protein IKX34_04575 [Bacteroidales bacterium]|nr:hypothetical protein [Bacteroidales bacterium]